MPQLSYMKVLNGAGRYSDPLSPILQIINTFLSRNLNVDFTRISVIIAIFKFAPAAIAAVSKLGLQAYGWIQRFFMVSVTVPAHDELYMQVLDWLSAYILKWRASRSLTARTRFLKGGDVGFEEYATFRGRTKVDTQYLPSLESVWFLYERRPFAVKLSPETPTAYERHRGLPKATEGRNEKIILTITSLGRSSEPIKRFLDMCRSSSRKQQETTITIRAIKCIRYFSWGWDVKAQKTARGMDSIHLDDAVKANLVSDIEHYLDPKTRRYYNSRHIPYRRGFLLHGPPGTGKTSLSLALAGEFGLDLYILDLSTVPSDDVLDSLFCDLPSPCLVLLEDIDVIGLKSRSDTEEQSSKKEKSSSVKCTLSGLLNVLDGVASGEGRILIVTSNMPDSIDEALLRPGRIDRKIYLGYVSKCVVERMFRRMFGGEYSEQNVVEGGESKKREHENMAAMALKFSREIPEETFTPAQIQEYLLQYQESPAEAVDQIASWVAKEVHKLEKKAQSQGINSVPKKGEQPRSYRN
ncbi:P-loop containing nucleoside triphosphate hydrolase protein [Hypoxylon sp. NC0597]|nr:P-loop containing nucleoside triphosphate hydrolase protein [Hypoxylon sp. NC0597]